MPALTLDQVRDRFPEVRESAGKRGLEYNVHCPQFHKKGGIYKLFINATDGAFVCQDCGYTGNAFKEWFDPLQEMFPDMFPKRPEPKFVKPRANARRGGMMWTEDVPAPGEVIPISMLPQDHVVWEYLKSREYDLDELHGLDPTRALYYCTRGTYSFPPPTFNGTTTGRLIIPVYMMRKLVGWQARSIEYVLNENKVAGEKIVWYGNEWRHFQKVNGFWEDKDIPKYYNSPQFPRRTTLFGFDMARNFKQVAVVEGALDYYKTGPECVSLLGGDGFATMEQIRLLKTYWDVLFWLLDPNVDIEEPETKRKFNKMLNELAPVKVYPLHLSSGKDPGATPRETTWREIAARVVERKTPHLPN